MSQVIFVLFIVGLGFLLLLPISLFFHEIGHAIPMLLFSKGPVLISIGRYKKLKKYIKFKIWRLQFEIHYKSFFSGGFAKMLDNKSLPTWKSLIINIWGPFFSITVCLFLLYFIVFTDIYGFYKVFFSALFFHSLLELFLLFQFFISFKDGYYSFSDGGNIYHNIFKKYSSHDINKALYGYYRNDFRSAVSLMQPIFDDGFKEHFFFYAYIVSLCHSDKSGEAFDYLEKMPYCTKLLTAHELSSIG